MTPDSLDEAPLDTLGPEWDPVFALAPNVQTTRPWLAATIGAALPEGARPRLLALRQNGRPAALLPLRQGPGRASASLTSPYTTLFQPLATAATAETLGRLAAPHLRRTVTRLEALDAGWPGLQPFLGGLRHGGILATRFDHFGNWHETGITGWPAYLAARPGALRETIRRRSRAAAQDPSIRFEIVTTPEPLPAAIQAYEDVYARSWKVPEPFPRFNATLLPRLAAAGLLRLGLLWRGATPLAAQYWTVEGTTATVLKLAHDDAVKGLSPGTLLTTHMIRALLAEGVDALDFGRGDDPYKASWVTCRRQRIGLVLLDPRHPAGALEWLRHQAGQLRQRLRHRVRG